MKMKSLSKHERHFIQRRLSADRGTHWLLLIQQLQTHQEILKSTYYPSINSVLVTVFILGTQTDRREQPVLSPITCHTSPPNTQRRNNVVTTSLQRQRRCNDVIATLCVYWEASPERQETR